MCDAWGNREQDEGDGKGQGRVGSIKGGGHISFIRKLRFQLEDLKEVGSQARGMPLLGRGRHCGQGPREGACLPCSRNRTAWRPLAGVEGVSGRV